MSGDGLIRPDIKFRRTAIGLWVPEEQQEARLTSELPLAIAQELVPPGPALFLAARRTQPDDTKAFFTEAEIDPSLGWTPLSRDDVTAVLTEMPLEVTVLNLAVLLKRLWGMGQSPREHLSLATEIFGDAQVVREMARFCSEDGHVVFSEQAIFSLLSHAVVHCRDSDVPGFTTDEHHAMLRLLLAAPGLLHEDQDLGEYDADNPEEWLAYLTQNLLFNAKANFGSGLARTWRIFGEIGRDPDRSWKASIELNQLEDPSGLSLEQQLGLAFGLHAILLKDDLVAVLPEGWLDLAQKVAPDRDPEEVVDSISASPTAMRAELTSTEAQQRDPLLRWASIPFLERPFLRLSDDRLLLVSPRALEAWPTDGVYYRLLRASKEKDGKRGVQQFTSLAGELTESYVTELVEAEHESTASRHLNAGTFRPAQPSPDGETSDAFIVRGGDVVVMEISSSRVTARTRLAGDLKALRRDMLKLVTKRVTQLDRTIEALVNGEVVLDGLPTDRIEHIYPWS